MKCRFVLKDSSMRNIFVKTLKIEVALARKQVEEQALYSELNSQEKKSNNHKLEIVLPTPIFFFLSDCMILLISYFQTLI